jgi:hypothetical protein
VAHQVVALLRLVVQVVVVVRIAQPVRQELLVKVLQVATVKVARTTAQAVVAVLVQLALRELQQ